MSPENQPGDLKPDLAAVVEGLYHDLWQRAGDSDIKVAELEKHLVQTLNEQARALSQKIGWAEERVRVHLIADLGERLRQRDVALQGPKSEVRLRRVQEVADRLGWNRVRHLPEAVEPEANDDAVAA